MVRRSLMSALARGCKNLVIFAVTACLSSVAQNVPDAPAPKIPPSSFPAGAPPAPKNTHPPETVPDPAAGPSSPDKPPQTVPQSQQQGGIATSREDLFTITRNVSFVEVPVTVKDGSGRLVEGLSPQDFTVYEDGVPQKLSYFSSDPFPLSAAIVVDTNLSSGAMKKINDSLPALVGAFSQFDEVALYRYGSTVQQVSGFNASGEIPSAALQQIKKSGRPGPGVPVTSGP